MADSNCEGKDDSGATKPELVSGPSTSGYRLPRISGSRLGDPQYYKDLEDWKSIECLTRVNNYTFEKIAVHKRSTRLFEGSVFALRDAETHAPLLLIYIHRQGTISVANLTGTHMLLSSDNCFDLEGTSVVIGRGHRRIGEVTKKEIIDHAQNVIYTINAYSNYQRTAVNLRYKPVSQGVHRPNNMCALHDLKRVLIQFMDKSCNANLRALTIISAARVYFSFEKEFGPLIVGNVYASNIHPILYDLVCKIPILSEIELPYEDEENPIQFDHDDSQLERIVEARIELAATIGKMYRIYFFVKNDQDKVVFISEKTSVQKGADIRFNNIDSTSTVFSSQNNLLDKDSQILLRHNIIGEIINEKEIKRLYVYLEKLYVEKTCDTNGNTTFSFCRGFRHLSMRATITYQVQTEQSVIKFEGLWDKVWKAIIISFACKFYFKYMGRIIRPFVANYQEIQELAQQYNSSC